MTTAVDTTVEDTHTESGLSGTMEEASLPSDPALLPEEDRALLELGMEELWASLNETGRQRLLGRLRTREVQRQRRETLRRERQELCARYIDLLCTMPRPQDPGYTAALAEMRAAKAAYLAAPRPR